ncbi:phosphopantetheine-binding protein [Streptomyces malaysiensis subsp. malaysiensis]
MTAVAELHAGGTTVDWATVLAGGRATDLPVYPFQHGSYWLAPVTRAADGAPSAGVPAPGEYARPSAPEEPRTMLELVRLEAAIALSITDPGLIADDSSFLDLGFDSISALRLSNRLAAVTGLDLPPSLLFDHPTPAELAARLDELSAADLDGAGVYALLEEIDELDEEDLDMTEEEHTAISELLAKLSAKWSR